MIDGQHDTLGSFAFVYGKDAAGLWPEAWFTENETNRQRFGGEARVVDLAAQLGVSHATVIQTVKRLQRDGLVTSEPYRSIFLTDIGRGMAKEAKHRHEVTVALLKKLGVGDETAEADAEGMEHHVSMETLKAFKHFLGE